MPTTRPRHIVTETDDIAAAIDAVQPRPGESRADVLRRLVLLGAQTARDAAAERGRLVRRHAGRHPGTFEPGYLDALRDEWPT
ncbi:MAG: hypothetical protein QM733_07455 [Ilumatobacteraceae bacterium]